MSAYDYDYSDPYAENAYEEEPMDMDYDMDYEMEEESEKPSMLLAINPVATLIAGFINYGEWSDTIAFDAWNQTYIYELVAGGVGVATFGAAYLAGVQPLIDNGAYIQIAIGLGNFFMLYKGNDNLSSTSNSTKISVALVTVGFLGSVASIVMGGSEEEEWMCDEETGEYCDDEEVAEDAYAEEDPYADDYYGGYY